MLNPFTGFAQDPKKNTNHSLANASRLEKDVHFLSVEIGARDAGNTVHLNKAADGIASQFAKAGLSVERQTFKVSGRNYHNIIASYGPDGGKRLIVGAHYDTAGPYPGADDNASGVAGILELARLLGEHRPLLKHRVDLVAYSLEELPYFARSQMGSYVHAQYLYEKKVPVKFMIALEMIGYYSDKPGSQKFPMEALRHIYPDTGNFIIVAGNLKQTFVCRRVKKRMQKHSKIDVHSINAPASIPGIDLSDHRSYWQFGYKAVMLTDTAFYRNPNYHTPNDTPDTLDYGRMAEVVNGVYGVIVGD